MYTDYLFIQDDQDYAAVAVFVYVYISRCKVFYIKLYWLESMANHCSINIRAR